MILFFFLQIIAFVLEGKKSKLTRRPKASDYQRLDQKVRKEDQVHGKALQPGPALGLHLAQKQQLVLGVLLPLPLPSSVHRVETSNVCVYSVRAKRPLITSQQLPPLTEEETQAQKSFFPLNSHLKYMAKSRPNGNSLGSHPVFFILRQHFTNFLRHCDKKQSDALAMGWSPCSCISRRFPDGINAAGTTHYGAKH